MVTIFHSLLGSKLRVAKDAQGKTLFVLRLTLKLIDRGKWAHFLIIHSMGRGSNKDLNSAKLSSPFEKDAALLWLNDEQNAM